MNILKDALVWIAIMFHAQTGESGDNFYYINEPHNLHTQMVIVVKLCSNDRVKIFAKEGVHIHIQTYSHLPLLEWINFVCTEMTWYLSLDASFCLYSRTYSQYHCHDSNQVYNI